MTDRAQRSYAQFSEDRDDEQKRAPYVFTKGKGKGFEKGLAKGLQKGQDRPVQTRLKGGIMIYPQKGTGRGKGSPGLQRMDPEFFLDTSRLENWCDNRRSRQGTVPAWPARSQSTPPPERTNPQVPPADQNPEESEDTVNSLMASIRPPPMTRPPSMASSSRWVVAREPSPECTRHRSESSANPASQRSSMSIDRASSVRSLSSGRGRGQPRWQPFEE